MPFGSPGHSQHSGENGERKLMPHRDAELSRRPIVRGRWSMLRSFLNEIVGPSRSLPRSRNLGNEVSNIHRGVGDRRRASCCSIEETAVLASLERLPSSIRSSSTGGTSPASEPVLDRKCDVVMVNRSFRMEGNSGHKKASVGRAPRPVFGVDPWFEPQASIRSA